MNQMVIDIVAVMITLAQHNVCCTAQLYRPHGRWILCTPPTRASLSVPSQTVLLNIL